MVDRQKRKAQSTSGHKKATHCSHVTQARLLAWETLQMVARENIYVHDAAHKVFDRGEYPETERSFALLLAAGVVSTKGILDETLNAILSNPHDIDARVRDALRISSYELLFLDKSSYAAVNQGVELVRAIAPRATGVANFALRRVAKQAEQSLSSLLDHLSDDKLASAFGFPEWIVSLLLEQKGRRWTEIYLRQANQSAPLYFFINQARVQETAVLNALTNHDIGFSRVSLGASSTDVQQLALPTYCFDKRKAVQHPLVQGLLDQGALVISDASAQMIASLALPKTKPASFLEIGAGRGIKTILLQDGAFARYGSFLELDSVEINPQKIAIARSQLKKAHIPHVRHWAQDAQDLSNFADGSYEAVFIDAPCSGLGTLRRHPEIRWRLKPEDLSELHALTVAILTRAAQKVASGGQLTYATCTVVQEENQSVVKEFLATSLGSEFVVEQVFETPLQTEGPDIHFACVLRRCEST